MTAVDALDQRLLRAFVVVAEELHFGHAARRLHISQPPLSVQIKKLEEAVGAVLFDRDRRHVALTDAGLHLLPVARRWLREADQVVSQLHRVAAGQSGLLRVGYTTPATYEILPIWLGKLRKASPELQLELMELRSGQQPAALLEQRIELGFACGPLNAAGVTEQVLFREPMVVALPSRHPLAARRKIPVRALRGQPAILARADIEPAWANAASEALGRAGVSLTPVQETDSKLALISLVAAGLGLSIVSRSTAKLRRRGVVFRELSGLDLQVPLTLLSLPERSPRASRGSELALELGRELADCRAIPR
ncbi:MAG: LysR family transcriptional regulator [Myxococcales bacterium]|nr:LysR family transcriptional regulator [Myxococcales bacterium]